MGVTVAQDTVMCFGIGVAANLGAAGSAPLRLEAQRLARNGFLASWLPVTTVLLLAWPDWSWWYWSGVEDKVGMALVLGVGLEVGAFWLGQRFSTGWSPPVLRRILLAVALTYVCLLVFPWALYSKVGSAEQYHAGAAVPLWENGWLLVTLVVGGAWMIGVLAATAARLYRMGALVLSLLLCAPLMLSACGQENDRFEAALSGRHLPRDSPAAPSVKAPVLSLAVSHDAEAIFRGWSVARRNELGVPMPEFIIRDEGQVITSLIDGRVDAALLHRRANGAEERYSRGDGLVARSSLSYEVLGYSSVVLVAHPENPIDVVALDRALEMLTGGVKDWAQVGNFEGPLHLYGGERSASTYVETQQLLDGTLFSERLQTMPSDKGVAGAVASDPLGLGLGSASSTTGVKVLGIRSPDGQVRKHLPLSIHEPESELRRQLYLVTPGEVPPMVAAFRKYALSKSGLAIAELNSYVVEQQEQ